MLDLLFVAILTAPVYGLLRLFGKKPSITVCAAFVAIPFMALGILGYAMQYEAGEDPSASGFIMVGLVIWYGLKEWAEERKAAAKTATADEDTGPTESAVTAP